MKFFKSNWVAILLVLGAVFCEHFHELFRNIEFRESQNTGRMLYYSAPIFYLNFSLFGSSLITSVFFFIKTKREVIASRMLLFGLIAWDCIEVIENVSYLAEINDNALKMAGTGWFQISFIIPIFAFAYWAFTKFKL